MPSQQIPSHSADIGSFRIHFADHTKIELSAATADEARKMAEERNSAKITKIKRVRT